MYKFSEIHTHTPPASTEIIKKMTEAASLVYNNVWGEIKYQNYNGFFTCKASSRWNNVIGPWSIRTRLFIGIEASCCTASISAASSELEISVVLLVGGKKKFLFFSFVVIYHYNPIYMFLFTSIHIFFSMQFVNRKDKKSLV